jgi:hypothetical protein
MCGGEECSESHLGAHQAMLYNAEEIINTCVNVIARNFSYIYNANYNILPYR